METIKVDKYKLNFTGNKMLVENISGLLEEFIAELGYIIEGTHLDHLDLDEWTGEYKLKYLRDGMYYYYQLFLSDEDIKKEFISALKFFENEEIYFFIQKGQDILTVIVSEVKEFRELYKNLSYDFVYNSKSKYIGK